ncbi:MAG: MerR family transcriptional regulator [Gemmatimonadota bacterium]
MAVDLRKPKTLTSEQVAEVLGVPQRALVRYVDAGLLHPHRTRLGTGSREVFDWSERDVQEARVAVALVRDLGLSFERAAPLMEQIRQLEDLTQPVYLQIVGPLEPGDSLQLGVTSKPKNPEQTLLPLALAS